MTLAEPPPHPGLEDVMAQEFDGTEADETLLGTAGNDT